MPAEAQIRAVGLGKTYRVGRSLVQALDGVALRVREGELVALVGVSGSGKSTLLNLLGGLDRPTRGSIAVDGCRLQDLSEPGLARFRRGVVGMVFQSFHLIPSLTALQNVALAMVFAGVPRREREERAREALRRVGLSGRAAAVDPVRSLRHE
jgi:putative ABC transport system ATP-binding protein